MHNGLGIEVLSGRGYGRKYGQGGAAAKLPRGQAICARGASATHWRATHVNWFTRRGWHKRYRRRHARACAPILFVGSGAHSHDPTGGRTGSRDLGAGPHRMSCRRRITLARGGLLGWWRHITTTVRTPTHGEVRGRRWRRSRRVGGGSETRTGRQGAASSRTAHTCMPEPAPAEPYCIFPWLALA